MSNSLDPRGWGGGLRGSLNWVHRVYNMTIQIRRADDFCGSWLQQRGDRINFRSNLLSTFPVVCLNFNHSLHALLIRRNLFIFFTSLVSLVHMLIAQLKM